MSENKETLKMKPCPFCGSTSLQAGKDEYGCLDCDSYIDTTKWNDRPEEERLHDQITKWEGKCAELSVKLFDAMEEIRQLKGVSK